MDDCKQDSVRTMTFVRGAKRAQERREWFARSTVTSHVPGRLGGTRVIFFTEKARSKKAKHKFFVASSGVCGGRCQGRKKGVA